MENRPTTPKTKTTRRRRIGRALANAAPGLAEAMGGPLAGAAVEAVKKAIFGEQAASEQDVEKAVEKMSPTIFLRLAEADVAFHKALWAAQNRAEQIAQSDRADARARQMAMGDKTPMVLGGVVIFGFFAVLGLMVFAPVPAGLEAEFSILLGALATMTAAVVNYYFGSSVGSREKTRLYYGGER